MVLADKVNLLVLQSPFIDNSAPPVIVAVGNGLIVTVIEPLVTLVQPKVLVAITE